MPKNVKQLFLSDDLKNPVVELGRITYKSSGISLYLPKSVVNALHLNKEKDRSLIIFSVEDKGFFLIKDTVLQHELKSEILTLRQKFVKI